MQVGFKLKRGMIFQLCDSMDNWNEPYILKAIKDIVVYPNRNESYFYFYHWLIDNKYAVPINLDEDKIIDFSDLEICAEYWPEQ